MAIRDIFKLSRKTFINPAGWMDFDALKAQNKTYYEILSGLLVPTKPEREETFEEAKQRQNLTEEDLQLSHKNFRLYALFFVCLAFLILAYSFYLLFTHHTLIGWLLGMTASGLFAAQAFKYDFWALQISQRKLGLTFNDWKRSILGDKGNSR